MEKNGIVQASYIQYSKDDVSDVKVLNSLYIDNLQNHCDLGGSEPQTMEYGRISTISLPSFRCLLTYSGKIILQQ
jgi:hypothetical protein